MQLKIILEKKTTHFVEREFIMTKGSISGKDRTITKHIYNLTIESQNTRCKKLTELEETE